MLVGIVAGCESTAAATGADATPPRDGAAVTDAVIVAADHPTGFDVLRPTPCPIVSAAPYAAHLAGHGYAGPDAGPPYPLRQELDLYLPQGRSPGAPVLLAFPTYWPLSALTVLTGRFDADGGVTGLDWIINYGGPLSFRGGMAAPSGGLQLQLFGNRNGTSDTVELVVGEASPCPAGDAPAPTLTATAVATPHGVLRLLPSAPVGDGVAGVRLTADGSPVASTAVVVDGALVVTAASWLRPGASVGVDLGALRDVMGRAFTLSGTLRTLATTAVVTDLEFTAAPPAGAVATELATATADGLLSVVTGPRAPYRVLVALGALTGATRLRASLRFRCSVEDFAVWIVAADGANTPLPIGPATATPDLTGARELAGPLPGTGPWWLYVENRSTPERPGWRGPLSACPVQFDRVVAE
ncbi:MAG: hypothetical protein JWM10_3954 [Myxococcaceae bacterium]|nr:hypothetical protein [Myxococcaceae bacterium]